jgi:hypothetical protein
LVSCPKQLDRTHQNFWKTCGVIVRLIGGLKSGGMIFYGREIMAGMVDELGQYVDFIWNTWKKFANYYQLTF